MANDIPQAGLLAQAGVAEQAPTEQAPAEQPIDPGLPVEQPQEGGASAEEQDNYEKIVMAGMKVLFDNKETQDQIVTRLKADAENPAKSLADTTAILMIQLDQQSGGNMPLEILPHAAVELLEQVSDLADSLGLFPVDEAVMNHAGQLMMVTLGEEYGADPAEMNALMDSTGTEELKSIETEQGNYSRKQPSREMVQ